MIDRAILRAQYYHGRHDRGVIAGIIRSLPSIRGGCGLLRHLEKAKSDEDFDDYLAEAWFVAVFLFCGYSVTIYPDGDAGPDLLIENSEVSFYVEVARFRPINVGPPGPGGCNDTDLLHEYGDFTRDTKKAMKKIFSKFRQIEERSAAIAIWNEDGALEELEFLAGVRKLRDDPAVPPGVEVVIYGSSWARCGEKATGPLQFETAPIRDGLSPWVPDLASALGLASWSAAIAAFTKCVV